MSEIQYTPLEIAKQAVKDEAGSRLCHLKDNGQRVCSREIASFCFCEDVASAVLESLRAFWPRRASVGAVGSPPVVDK